MSLQDRLVWIDLEMTGLDPERDFILEIATLVTDADLQPVAVGPVLAVQQSEAVLAAMDEWNQRTHTASGLLARVRASAISARQAEESTLAFLG
ncbi:MAG: oligoribonuclease, partial [Steroidobacteraceae bacterium]|nr:oligoribonuclease [Steroidobacteraceae bacterium]